MESSEVSEAAAIAKAEELNGIRNKRLNLN